MRRVIAITRRAAFRNGVAGTSSRWFGLWVLITLAQRAHRLLGKEEVVVERITLKRGQVVEIRDTGVSRGSFEAS